MKPLKWWLHKCPCEIWYWIYAHTFWQLFPTRMYYRHLDAICSTGYNLYGKWIGINTMKYKKA